MLVTAQGFRHCGEINKRAQRIFFHLSVFQPGDISDGAKVTI